MTVEELNEVIRDRHADTNARLEEIRGMIEKQNGRVARAEEEITKLRIADAYWAGSVVAVIAIIKLLLG